MKKYDITWRYCWTRNVTQHTAPPGEWRHSAAAQLHSRDLRAMGEGIAYIQSCDLLLRSSFGRIVHNTSSDYVDDRVLQWKYGQRHIHPQIPQKGWILNRVGQKPAIVSFGSRNKPSSPPSIINRSAVEQSGIVTLEDGLRWRRGGVEKWGTNRTIKPGGAVTQLGQPSASRYLVTPHSFNTPSICVQRINSRYPLFITVGV